MTIEIKEISKYYGKQKALDKVSIILDTGVYALLGPNGAGKSTLLKALVGLVDIDSGTIFYEGKVVDLNFLNNIGFLPQGPILYPNYTAYEFLRYMCVQKGYPNGKIKHHCLDLLSKVNLKDDNKLIKNYSGGMRQRLGIAQALINEPKVIILDEPTAGLDPKERLIFRNMISALGVDRTIIIATHIVSDVEQIAKEIIVLKEGVVLFQKPTSELLNLVKGKVWALCTEDSSLVSYIQNKVLISNYHFDGLRYNLKVVADTQHLDIMKVANPSLEDFYIATFGGNLE